MFSQSRYQACHLNAGLTWLLVSLATKSTGVISTGSLLTCSVWRVLWNLTRNEATLPLSCLQAYEEMFPNTICATRKNRTLSHNELVYTNKCTYITAFKPDGRVQGRHNRREIWILLNLKKKSFSRAHEVLSTKPIKINGENNCKCLKFTVITCPGRQKPSHATGVYTIHWHIPILCRHTRPIRVYTMCSPCFRNVCTRARK
jgi:hypothetical protein